MVQYQKGAFVRREPAERTVEFVPIGNAEEVVRRDAPSMGRTRRYAIRPRSRVAWLMQTLVSTR